MTFVPGAASTVVRDLLARTRDVDTIAEVRHVGRTRVALAVGDRLLVLESAPGAGTLPCSVVVPRLDPARIGAAGDGVRLTPTGVHGRSLVVQVTRWWHPARVQPCSCEVPRCEHRSVPPARAASRLADDVVAAAAAAARHLAGRRPHEAAAALETVLGLGAGSTPDADDVAAGLWLAARRGLPREDTAALEDAGAQLAAAAPGRTTALSAELLRLASVGVAAPAVVDAVQRPSGGSRAALIGLGATSGAATAYGIDVLRAALDQRLEVAA